MMYDGWWGGGWGWGGRLLMSVVTALFWLAVMTAIVLAIRYLVSSGGARGRPPRYKPPRPEDVLAGRFARGEIDEVRLTDGSGFGGAGRVDMRKCHLSVQQTPTALMLSDKLGD